MASSTDHVVGDTDLIKLIKDVVNGTATHSEVKDFLTQRSSGVNIPDKENKKTPLHWACSPMSRRYQCREQVIETLLDFGANCFMTDNTGTPCVLASPDPSDREAAVGTFLRYRLEKEQAVESVAPLGASRLMKRSEGDRGYGVFSNVATHCLFYLYKGALYLWDTKEDIEHVLYQPRHIDPSIAAAEAKLASHMRKKSFAARGGEIDETFDFQDEQVLLRRLERLEGTIPLVTHFVLAAGLDAEQCVISKEHGVAEWIVTDTGVMITVQMNTTGLILARSDDLGFYNSGASANRRKSHVCGAAASYAAGTSPKIKVYQNTAIRYHKHTVESAEIASNSCCAIDGLRGVIAYVVASEPAETQRVDDGHRVQRLSVDSGFGRQSMTEAPPSGAGPRFMSTSAGDGDRPFGSPSAATGLGFSGRFSIGGSSSPGQSPRPDGLLDPLNGQGDRRRSTDGGPRVAFGGLQNFAATSSSAGGESGRGEGTKPPAVGIWKNEEDDKPKAKKLVFRVIHTDMFPKGGLSDAMKQLTKTYNSSTGQGGDHFEGCRISEYRIPYPVIDDDALEALSQQRKNGGGSNIGGKHCAVPDPISVHQLGATKFILFTKNGPIVAETETYPATFHIVRTSPQGEIQYGTAKHAPQVGRLRTVLKRCFFVEVSEVVEVLELNLITYEATPIFRSCGDRYDLHKILPIFHPTEESLCLLYQAIKRQELCKLDLNTMKFQSVCRLPKPSSLRFYATVHGQQSLSELYFAFAKSGQQLLRYNVSMHVMSIYSWEEMTWQGDQQFINCTMVRNPVAIDVGVLQQQEVAKEARATGDPCTWLVMQSQSLAAHVLAGNGVASDPFNAPNSQLTSFNAIGGASPAGGGGLLDSPGKSQSSHTASPATSTRPETPAEVLLGNHFAKTVKSFGHNPVSGKPARVPLKTSCWAAAFPAPLDAVRCGLKLLRSTMDEVKWPSEILEANGEHFQAVKMPYRPKTELQKKYPTSLDTLDDQTAWTNRGPKVRLMVVSGHLNDHTALVTRELEKVITQSTDGVVAVDGPVMKVVKPLLAFATPCQIAESKIGRVTAMVPAELDHRLL